MLTFIKRYPWLIPTFIFAVLVFWGANNHILFNDETETALFARNILKHGVPMAWDGKNLMGLENGGVINKNLINHFSPPLQFYLTAFSFKLFGDSSFTARLPFIPFGVALLPLLYYFTKKLTNNSGTAFIAMLSASLSVPLILYSYQARYYSLVIFSTTATSYCLLKITDRGPWPKILFIISATLLFYAHFLTFFIFLPILLLATSLYIKPKILIRAISLPLLAVAILTAPWFFYFQPWAGKGTGLTPRFFNFGDFFSYFYQSLSQTNLNNDLPIVFATILLVIALIALFRKIKNKSELPNKAIIYLFLIYYLFLTIIAYTTSLDITIFIFTVQRYLIPIIPFAFILTAILLQKIYSWNAIIFIPILLIYLFTNVFSLNSSTPSYLLAYFNEQTSSYRQPDVLVADYLQKNAQDGDTAFVNLDRDIYPLMYLLKDKTRFVNVIKKTENLVFPENKDRLPQYLSDIPYPPDWVIEYGKNISTNTPYNFDKFEQIKQTTLNLNRVIEDYRRVPLKWNVANDYEVYVYKVFFLDTTRPEIIIHSFSEQLPASSDDYIYIYHLKPEAKQKIKNE